MLQQVLCEQNCNLLWPTRTDAAKEKTADLSIIFYRSLAGLCHPCLRIRQILWAFKCVSNKNMSQIKSLLLVKPNKRLAHSSAICCLYVSLPPVPDETTACAPTFRSASPGKAPLANKQLLQKSCYVLCTRFHTSTCQNPYRIQGVLCCSCLWKGGWCSWFIVLLASAPCV